MLLAYGFLHRVFETFDKYHTAIDMMATSEVGVTVTIDNTEYLADIVDTLKGFATVSVDSDMVIICVVVRAEDKVRALNLLSDKLFK